MGNNDDLATINSHSTLKPEKKNDVEKPKLIDFITQYQEKLKEANEAAGTRRVPFLWKRTGQAGFSSVQKSKSPPSEQFVEQFRHKFIKRVTAPRNVAIGSSSGPHTMTHSQVG